MTVALEEYPSGTGAGARIAKADEPGGHKGQGPKDQDNSLASTYILPRN